MEYSDRDCSITLTENVITFSGKLEKSNYTDINTFLRKVDRELPASSSCVIELQKLNYLNSSGIKSLATFILGSPRQFELHINTSLTWQTESIPALKHLKPQDITIVS